MLLYAACRRGHTDPAVVPFAMCLIIDRSRTDKPPPPTLEPSGFDFVEIVHRLIVPLESNTLLAFRPDLKHGSTPGVGMQMASMCHTASRHVAQAFHHST